MGGKKKKRRLNRDAKTQIETCMNCVDFFCAYMNQVVIQPRQGVEGAVSFGALSSFCLTTGIYLILFFKNIWEIRHGTGYVLFILWMLGDEGGGKGCIKERYNSGRSDIGDQGSR